MKNLLLFIIVLSFTTFTTKAQFIEDFESYIDGELVCEDPWGEPYTNDYCVLVSSDFAHSGIKSGQIPYDGSIETYLDLGNRIFGTWSVSFLMYIPSDREASWKILGSLPISGSESAVGTFFFNKDLATPGVGYLDWDTATTTDDSVFNFPHNEWFSVIFNIDISTGMASATWDCCVNNMVVATTGTPFKSNSGTNPSSLGGVLFSHIGNYCEYYIDDVYFQDYFIPFCGDISTEEFATPVCTIYPNPVTDQLSINNSNNLNIQSIQIYDILGNLVIKEHNNLQQIDVSSLKSGVYIVKIETDRGVLSRKVVKNS